MRDHVENQVVTSHETFMVWHFDRPQIPQFAQGPAKGLGRRCKSIGYVDLRKPEIDQVIMHWQLSYPHKYFRLPLPMSYPKFPRSTVVRSTQTASFSQKSVRILSRVKPQLFTLEIQSPRSIGNGNTIVELFCSLARTFSVER